MKQSIEVVLLDFVFCTFNVVTGAQERVSTLVISYNEFRLHDRFNNTANFFVEKHIVTGAAFFVKNIFFAN